MMDFVSAGQVRTCARLLALVATATSLTGCPDAPTEPDPAPVIENLTVQLSAANNTVIGTRTVSANSGVLSCTMQWTATASGTGSATWNDVTWTVASSVGTPVTKTESASLFVTTATPFSVGTQTLQGSWNWTSSESSQPRYRTFTVTVAMSYTQQGELKQTAPITIACDPPAPEVIALSSGAPVTGVSALAGYSKLYRITVPTGTLQLSVTTAEGTGDLDLYLRKGEAPTLTTSDCNSHTATATESCTVENPAGDWYILLYAWSQFSGVTLTATASSTPQTPGFTIAGPSSLSIASGGTASLAVTATRTGGFADAIALSVEGLPAQVSATSATIAAGATSATITLTATSTAAAGTTTATVRGKATGLSDRTVALPVTVTTGGGPSGAVIELLHGFQYAAGSSLNTSDGRNPEAGLVQGGDGNFYGVTSSGGMPTNGSSGKGTAFRITPSGQLTTLVTFEHFTVNGENPRGALVKASDGNLYGVAVDGTFFRISTAGAYTKIVRSAEIGGSLGRLVQGTDGSFYGTTVQGGASSKGTVFKVTTAGAVTTIATFTGANGSLPYAGLKQGPDGNFYGTTSSGGANGFGTVFKVTPSGQLTTLVSFTGGGAGKNGSSPRSQLALGADGNFYGTTHAGGTYGSGTVFRVTPAGILTTLHTFNLVTPELGCNCGLSDPYGGLVLASDGNFYGTTQFGQAAAGPGGKGAVFRLTPAGVFSVVGYFSAETAGTASGQGPMDNLRQGSDGRLYGTTYSGGTAGLGTVFRVNIGT